MIPRTKVNYSASELMRAACVSEQSQVHRDALRSELRSLLGMEHVLLTPSGRGALYYLLRTLPQPRVVVPGYTCKAVVEAARLAGKEVVHLEVEPDGFNMDVGRMAPLLDASTIVIATHQFGIPCDIQRLCELCARHGSLVIEDVAAALGSRVNGQLTGTFGAAAFFSFDSTKLINVPLKAGFLATRDGDLLAKVEAIYRSETQAMTAVRKWLLLAQGFVLLLLENPLLYRCFHKLMFEWRGQFTADGPALNLTLTPFYREVVAEWQAYLAVQQLRRLDAIIERRRDVYSTTREGLKSCSKLLLPPEDVRREWACIRFPIRVQGDKLAFYREANKRGIDFAFSFTFIDCPETMKHAHRLAGSVLDLPYYTKLTDAEMRTTIAVIQSLAA